MNLFFDDSDDERSYSGHNDELTAAISSECSSSRSSLNDDEETRSPHTPHDRQKPRKSLRQHLVRAISSPAKIARNSIASPNKRASKINHKNSQRTKSISQKSRKEHKSWREEFDLPADITREEAMAVLLCLELEMMDL